MQKGGARNLLDTLHATRYAGLVMTIVLALYSVFVANNLLPSTHYVDDAVLVWSLASLSVLMSLFLYVKEARSKTDIALQLIVYHAIVLSLFTMAIGFWQPFVAVYILLFIASREFFGIKGFLWSVLALVSVSIVDATVRFEYSPEIVYQTGLAVCAVIFIGTMTIALMHARIAKHASASHSRERERLQYDRVLTIMNNLSDAAFSTDEHGKILMYNAAALDLLDTNDSLKGKLIGDVLKLRGEDEKKVNIYSLLQQATRSTRRDDLTHTYLDGESIRLEITYAPIRSTYNVSKKRDEHGGYILIVRDVTKKKSLEEERDEFISVVSHELRTPITIVEGTLSNLDVLMNRPEAPDAKVLSSSIMTAHEQVLYLAKMVNDLSTLSRAERGVADTPEVIDVAELLTNLHVKYEKEASDKKLHLNLDLGPKLGTVNVSRLYLEELLQNFITNAIKYTKEGSITIIAKRSKNKVTFSVADTGIGISRTDQNKVFNKFYRSEDYRIRETNGTGLGLYVSTKLARKLQTQINLTSRLNHGSTFSFELQGE